MQTLGDLDMRKLLSGIFFSVLCLGSTSAMAAFKCDAYAGLNRYHFAVELDRETLAMSIVADDGYVSKGQATKSVSGRTAYEYFFLSTGFGMGYELQIPREGSSNSPAFCVKPNECYSCR
jgi:hypothetical protein